MTIKAEIKKHKDFVKRAMHYFNISHPVIIKYDPSIEDIAVINNTILVGDKWMKADPREQEKRIVHEFLHLIGFEDNEEDIKYFSDPMYDIFSFKVWKDMQQHDIFNFDRVCNASFYTVGRNYLTEHIASPWNCDAIRTVKSGKHRIRICYSDHVNGRHEKYQLISILHPLSGCNTIHNLKEMGYLK